MEHCKMKTDELNYRNHRKLFKQIAWTWRSHSSFYRKRSLGRLVVVVTRWLSDCCLRAWFTESDFITLIRSGIVGLQTARCPVVA